MSLSLGPIARGAAILALVGAGVLADRLVPDNPALACDGGCGVPGRFLVVSGHHSVSLKRSGVISSTESSSTIKIDTVTGETWALQEYYSDQPSENDFAGRHWVCVR